MGMTKRMLEEIQTWEDLDRTMEMYFIEKEQEYINQQIKQAEDESN